MPADCTRLYYAQQSGIDLHFKLVFCSDNHVKTFKILEQSQWNWWNQECQYKPVQAETFPGNKVSWSIINGVHITVQVSTFMSHATNIGSKLDVPAVIGELLMGLPTICMHIVVYKTLENALWSTCNWCDVHCYYRDLNTSESAPRRPIFMYLCNESLWDTFD